MKTKKEGQKPKKPGFLSWNIGILKESFKRITLKDAILILILDALFYLFSGYLFLFWLQRINEKMESVYLPFDLASAGAEKIQQAAKDAQSFYYLLIFSFILLVIAVVFLSSIFKGIIWAKTTSTKITPKLMSKFLLLNVVWLGFWLVIMFLISWLVQVGSVRIFMLGAILISVYLTNITYAIFMREQTTKSLAKAISLGFAKMHIFLLPYAIMLALFYIALVASSLLKIDYYSLYAVNNLYAFLGFDFSNGFAGSAVLQANFLIALLVSLLANPLLLVCSLISRYYISTLVMHLNKSK